MTPRRRLDRRGRKEEADAEGRPLYARHSSENQRDASFEDQLRLYRLRAERRGWTIVDSYADQAISGMPSSRSSRCTRRVSVGWVLPSRTAAPAVPLLHQDREFVHYRNIKRKPSLMTSFYREFWRSIILCN